MTFKEIIELLKEKTSSFDGSAYNGFLAIQITLKDLEEIFYVEIKDGNLSIEPYDYHDRQAHLIISSEKFLKLINKKLNPVTAYASGQLKVEGDAGKALELADIFA